MHKTPWPLLLLPRGPSPYLNSNRRNKQGGAAYRRRGRSSEGRGWLREVLAVTARYDSTVVVAGIGRSTCAGGWTRRRECSGLTTTILVNPRARGASQGVDESTRARNWRTTHRGARSTFTGGRVKSGNRELASPARQSLIPRSGSFTEARRVYSVDRTGLGEALLAGLRWRGIGWPRARRARGNAGDLVLRWGRARAAEYGRSPWWLYRCGCGQRH
jgi:hypothetical protein